MFQDPDSGDWYFQDPDFLDNDVIMKKKKVILQRPTAAHGSPYGSRRRPTAAHNGGPRRPTAAHSGPQRPTAAHSGPQRRPRRTRRRRRNK